MTIGGTGAGEGNVIAFNKGAGVFVGYTSLGTIRAESDPRQLDLLATAPEPIGARDAGYRSRRIHRRIGRGRAHRQRPRRRGHGAQRLSELSADLFGRFDFRRGSRTAGARRSRAASTASRTPTFDARLLLERRPASAARRDFLEGRTYLGSSVRDDRRRPATRRSTPCFRWSLEPPERSSPRRRRIRRGTPRSSRSASSSRRTPVPGRRRARESACPVSISSPARR